MRKKISLLRKCVARGDDLSLQTRLGSRVVHLRMWETLRYGEGNPAISIAVGCHGNQMEMWEESGIDAPAEVKASSRADRLLRGIFGWKGSRQNKSVT